ncbi:hypothetical protein GE061_007612 [Apolygus lucorum]|uniref:Uncharacterized protein n=1 Tax=Apolygus lucorum TaxID=248454 RepID=A0A6A4IWQ8_APOLU|nr:hypothetical protein GE061_007612 [Apolygus lucorum]
MTMDYQKLECDDPPAVLSRKSSFRASLRRMSSVLGGRESADRKQVNVTPRAPAKLPVVSFYSAREQPEMRLRRKSSVRVQEGPPSKKLKEDLAALSPSSRLRVGRLVKTLGPEAYEAVKREVQSRTACKDASAKCASSTKCASAPCIKCDFTQNDQCTKCRSNHEFRPVRCTKCGSNPLRCTKCEFNRASKPQPHTFGRNFRKCPDTVLPDQKYPEFPVKRRRSLGDLMEIEEVENQPPETTIPRDYKLRNYDSTRPLASYPDSSDSSRLRFRPLLPLRNLSPPTHPTPTPLTPPAPPKPLASYSSYPDSSDSSRPSETSRLLLILPRLLPPLRNPSPPTHPTLTLLTPPAPLLPLRNLSPPTHPTPTPLTPPAPPKPLASYSSYPDSSDSSRPSETPRLLLILP